MADTIRRPDSDTTEERPVGDLVDLAKARADRVPHPAPAPADLVPDLPEDPDGDQPFIPAWVRTPEGRKAARVRARRSARRAVRRWATRQRTERGHATQIARGTRRAHEWVIGVEGVNVQAAKHQAHTATRTARDAARRARFTAMPKQRQAAAQHADRAQTAAIAAVATYKKTKQDVRRGRLLRGALACGTPLAVTLTGWVEAGLLGTVCGVCATGATLAFIGRKPLTAEAWDPERRSLGDGDALDEAMLQRAFVAAKVITEGQQLQLRTPCIADGPDAWQVMLDLPDGVTVNRVRERVVELAAALGIDRSQLDLRQAGGAGRLALWASMRDPFAVTRRSPLIDRDEPLNTWRDGIPLAFDKRGNIVSVTVSDYSMLFGGATRSGKGMGLANVLAGAMLDPRVRIRLFDGKGSGEYVPFAPLLATYVRRNPRRLVEFLRVMVDEMNRRTEILVDLGLSKLSEELIEKIGGIELVIVDELATYTASEGPSKEYAEEIAELLAQIGAVGAAVGIVLALATQFPEVGIVKSRLRGNLAGRMAMRTESADASNVILGKGMAGQGYDSSAIPNEKTARGRAWLTTPDTGVIEVRSLFIDEKTREILRVVTVATALRRIVGTLPGQYPDPVEAEMLRLTGASATAGGPTGRGGIVRGTVLDHMVTAAAGTGRGVVTNGEVFAALADVDPDRYRRAEGESEPAWMSRAGKALRAQLAEVGVDLEPVRVTAADGSRPNGYTLPALQKAADDARNARP